MRAIFGDTAGEEVTLAGSQNWGLGSHLLAYRTRHFSGAWHGGCLAVDDVVSLLKMAFYLITKSRACGRQNDLQDTNVNGWHTVLTGIADSREFPKGFAYAAHPLNSSMSWPEEMIQAGFLGSRPRSISSAPPREFVLKGLQVWNGRSTRFMEGNIDFKQDIDFYNLNPFATWMVPADPWAELTAGLIKWHGLVRQGLAFSLDDDKDARFIRKIYISGGTDAHGDFNYETAIPSTFLHDQTGSEWGWTVSNSAFGVVRTHVDAGQRHPGDSRTTVERALDALSYGNTVITDGPVITFMLDSDLRFDSRTHIWNDNVDDLTPGRWNSDGEIGGGPGTDGRSVGAFDGGRTMLVRRGSLDMMIRYRWHNIPEFGGTPVSIQIYRDAVGALLPRHLKRCFRLSCR
jgi:hypothetical protein